MIPSESNIYSKNQVFIKNSINKMIPSESNIYSKIIYNKAQGIKIINDSIGIKYL